MALTLAMTAQAATALQQRLQTLRIEQVQFREASVPEVMEFLSRQSGINFVLIDPGARARPVTMQLRDVPVAELVRYVAELAGLRVRVDRHAVVLLGPEAVAEQMETRIYRVYGHLFQPLRGLPTAPGRLRRPEDF
jgi:general secretion pathway protein D